MFTKQHYVVLARLIQHNTNLDRFVEDLILELKADSKKFNEKKFREDIRRD